MTFKVFETERLRVRPLRRRDATLFVSLYSDVETMRFIGRPLSKQEARASFEATLEEIQTRKRLAFFAIVEKLRRPIGFCSIQPPQPRARRAEIGLILMREARRRGFGAECARALIAAAFGALPIDTVWVQYRPANASAERLFGGIGFQPKVGPRPLNARPANRIRVMQRIAWSTSTTKRRGKHNVEHDGLS
jgi:ribosomal-protein-alanine N-acetyltransferase